MVMYEDDAQGYLSLVYDYRPSASEVIKDIAEAPIERGETFQNKKKGKKVLGPLLDEWIIVDADLGEKAAQLVYEEMEGKGFKAQPFTVGNTIRTGFKIPDEAPREEY